MFTDALTLALSDDPYSYRQCAPPPRIALRPFMTGRVCFTLQKRERSADRTEIDNLTAAAL